MAASRNDGQPDRPKRDDGLQLSLVIPCYRGVAYLAGLLEVIVEELGELSHEILVADSTGDGAAARRLSGLPAVRVLESARRLSPGGARNLGAACARGNYLLFIDADCLPLPGWGRVLKSLLAGGRPACSGAIVNGTPGSLPGTIQYWVEFPLFTPGSAAGPPPFLPSYLLLIRRELFASSGGFAEDFVLAEDVSLSACLLTAGVPLHFEPSWRVRHANRTCWTEVLAHLRKLGAGSGMARRQGRTRRGSFLKKAPWLSYAMIVYSWLKVAGRLLRAADLKWRRKLCLICILPLGFAWWWHGFARGVRGHLPGNISTVTG